jgi:hypothetical protein
VPYSDGYVAVSRLSDTDFVVAYRDSGNFRYGMVRVGTISGGNVSWRTTSTSSAYNTSTIAVSALSRTDFVVAYLDWGNSGYGTARVGTVSGGNVSWGAESLFNAAATPDIATSSLSATDFVVAYRDSGNSGYGTARVGTVDGGNVSWGTESVFHSVMFATYEIAISRLSGIDYVVAYRDRDNSDYGTARVRHKGRCRHGPDQCRRRRDGPGDH